MRGSRAVLVSLAVFVWHAVWLGAGACNPPPPPGSVCTPGNRRCNFNALEVCADDGASYVVSLDCNPTADVCVSTLGCVACVPGTRTCDGLDILRCRSDGSGVDVLATCDEQLGDVCSGGECRNACNEASEDRSYEGCEYWAVDLDNAVVADQGAAAAQQFSVVLSNAGVLTADVTVEIMCTEADAANPAIGCVPGLPHILETFPVAPKDLQVIDLDPREVDGASNPALNDGPGTFRSMSAFRISSDAPLIVYQFNPLENVNVFSNDASLLLPTDALDTRYTVLSWPQTLAITDDDLTNSNIDLRAFLTVVGIEDGTYVTVELSTDILGGADIPAAAAGETIGFFLDRFEVVNLETDGFNADFTSTYIRADRPIAVFTGSEASDVPFFETRLERSCCADHLEEQLFGESALGKIFVAVKTPARTFHVDFAGWDVAVVRDEPEYFRILATADGTTVQTDLPPPQDTFAMQRGDSVLIETERDFLVTASNPIVFSQFPASQATTGIPSTLPGGERPPGGDPSFILVPPIEQWRNNYLFLVPNKYAFDFLLIAAPTTAELLYDGMPLDTLACTYEPIGTLEIDQEEIEYQAIRCKLSFPMAGDLSGGLQDDGVHSLESANGDTFGLIVYGWDSFVSYGYPGGTNVEIINPY